MPCAAACRGRRPAMHLARGCAGRHHCAISRERGREERAMYGTVGPWWPAHPARRSAGRPGASIRPPAPRQRTARPPPPRSLPAGAPSLEQPMEIHLFSSRFKRGVLECPASRKPCLSFRVVVVLCATTQRAGTHGKRGVLAELAYYCLRPPQTKTLHRATKPCFRRERTHGKAFELGGPLKLLRVVPRLPAA